MQMEGFRRTRWISRSCNAAALLICLSLVQFAYARDGQSVDPRDSVVPIVVMSDASREPNAAGASAEDRSEFAVDGAAGSRPLFADVPFAAWLLLAVCLLGAGFGPRAVRGLRDDAQDPAPREPQKAPTTHRTVT
jgi:hypothetical protein